jgi:hypothetical protein
MTIYLKTSIRKDMKSWSMPIINSTSKTIDKLPKD